MKNIKKVCNVYEDSIILTFEDTRDNYVYDDALGMIGEIHLSSFGVLINPSLDVHEERIEKLRSRKLSDAFEELFGKEEYDPISEKYYQKIQTMISNGELSSLGYTINKKIEDYEDDYTLPQSKLRRY